jgi:hypothetical protein
MSTSPTYRVWGGMIQRCENAKSACWAYYGGRGIRVCERWRRDFTAFLADMGERPASLTIERLDVNGDYEPGNCVWADTKTQSLNKRSSRYVVVGGERLTVSQISERLAISQQTLLARLNRGVVGERLLAVPVRHPAKVVEVRQERRPGTVVRRLVQGEMLSANQILARYGVARSTLYRRLARGQPAEFVVAEFARWGSPGRLPLWSPPCR